MQYTPHYNLNLPEGSDIVNPLIQDNPNYTAIDTAMYNNKLRVVGTATHVKTGTNHAITLGDSDINQFKFVATGDYASGDTFTVDGVTVTARIADGSSIPSGAFKINSTVLAVLDGTILNLINVNGLKPAAYITYDNTSSGLSATNVQDAIDEVENEVAAIPQIEKGTFNVSVAQLSDAVVSVSFDHAFPGTPKIVVSQNDGTSYPDARAMVYWSVSSKSTTGFGFYAKNNYPNGSLNMIFDYIAIY